MRAKILEVRDRMTFIPMLCVDMNAENDQQRWLLRSAGYSCDFQPIIVMTNGKGHSTYDPYEWNDRTRTVAHNYIQEHWHSLKDGDVVDVEYILGEKPEPSVSQRAEEGPEIEAMRRMMLGS